MWLRTETLSHAHLGVDRETEVIRGYVLAQEGPFKSGRGEFDRQSLDKIVELANGAPNGLKSRFAHPTLSDDGIGKFLGRARNVRLSEVAGVDNEGRSRSGPVAAVRGDLHLDRSAHHTPSGDLADYVLDLADSDPRALSSSLVLQTDKEYRLKPDGTAQTDDDGEPLPPLWRPTHLHASDLVDSGDAVDGLLSLDASGLPDHIVRQASDLLTEQFPDLGREELRQKALAWLDRYLDQRFGERTPLRLDARFRRRRIANQAAESFLRAISE